MSAGRARGWGGWALAALLAASGVGCLGASAPVRQALSRGDLAGALTAYQHLSEERGEGDADLLAVVATEALRRAAGSDDPAARSAGFAAIRALGPRGRDILEGLAPRPGVVGDRAAAALWDLDNRSGRPPARLRAALDSDDRERRVAGMSSLRGRSGVERLLSLLASPDAQVRQAAVSQLSRRRADARVTDALVARVTADGDAGVRAAAVVALAGRGESVVPALRAALEDRESFVRMAAVSALVATSWEAATERLGAMLDGPPTPLTIEVARALAQRGDERAGRYLLSAMRAGRRELRAQAAVASGFLAGTRAAALAERLSDDEPEVVLRVAGALVRVEAYRPAALAALRPLSRRPDGFVAIRALSTLAAYDEPGVLEPVRRALTSPEPTVRRLAVLAWPEAIGASDDCDPLAPLLRDPDRSVQMLAAVQIILIASR